MVRPLADFFEILTFVSQRKFNFRTALHYVSETACKKVNFDNFTVTPSTQSTSWTTDNERHFRNEPLSNKRFTLRSTGEGPKPM